MKKLISILMCGILTLSFGLISACTAPTPDTDPSTPPAATGITESQWDDILYNSSIENATVLEAVTTNTQTSKNNTEYYIDGNRVYKIYSGITFQLVTDATEVASIKAMFNFYADLSFDKLTYNAEKDNYNVSGSIVVNDGDKQYTFTDVTISVNTKIFVINKISATRVTTTNGVAGEENYISLTYSDFGSTSANPGN